MSNDERPEEKSEKPRIKVTDRRKFTATGEVRPAADEPAPESGPDEEPVPQPPAAEAPVPPEGIGEPSPPPRAAGGPAPESMSREASGTTAEPPRERISEPPLRPEGEASRPPGPLDINALPRDFTAFIEGMYLETMLYLGAMPDPRTGEPADDLDMAKYKIDLLGMLQEKTRGNLTDEEGQQLEEVLYQLRMFYVQTRKKAGG